MSKNFEEEYHKMLNSEIPDLWDRIEARLPDQATSEEMSEHGESQEEYGNNRDENMAVSHKNRINIRRMSLILMASAAILCAVVILPVFITSSNRKHTAAVDSYTDYDGEDGAEAACDDSSYVGKPSLSVLESEEACGTLEQSNSVVYDGGALADREPSEQLSGPNEDCAAGSSFAGTTDGESVQAVDEYAEETAAAAEGEQYRTQIELTGRIEDQGKNVYLLCSVVSSEDGDALPAGMRLYLRAPQRDEAGKEIDMEDMAMDHRYTVVLYTIGETPDEVGIPDTGRGYYASEVFVIYEVIDRID